MHTAELEQFGKHTHLQRCDTGVTAMEHTQDGAVLLPFHTPRLQGDERCALCHLRGLCGAEPDGIGTYQRASQRVHQDGRSERAVGNLRGVRYHHVGHRQSADTLYG